MQIQESDFVIKHPQTTDKKNSESDLNSKESSQNSANFNSLGATSAN